MNGSPLAVFDIGDEEECSSSHRRGQCKVERFAPHGSRKVERCTPPCVAQGLLVAIPRSPERPAFSTVADQSIERSARVLETLGTENDYIRSASISVPIWRRACAAHVPIMSRGRPALALPNSAVVGSIFETLGPMFADLGQTFGPMCLSTLGPSSGCKVRPALPIFGPRYNKFGQQRHNHRPAWARFGRMWPESGHKWPTLPNVGSNLGRIGQMWREFGQHRLEVGRIQPALLQQGVGRPRAHGRHLSDT